MSYGSNWLRSCRREVEETMKPTYKGKELLPLSVIDAARDGDAQAVDQVLGIMRAISISSAPGRFTILTVSPMFGWTST